MGWIWISICAVFLLTGLFAIIKGKKKHFEIIGWIFTVVAAVVIVVNIPFLIDITKDNESESDLGTIPALEGTTVPESTSTSSPSFIPSSISSPTPTSVPSPVQYDNSQSPTPNNPITSSEQKVVSLDLPAYINPNFLDNRSIITVEENKIYTHKKSDDTAVVYKVNNGLWIDFSTNKISKDFILNKICYPLKDNKPITEYWESHKMNILVAFSSCTNKFDDGQILVGYGNYDEFYLVFECDSEIDSFEFSFAS